MRLVHECFRHTRQWQCLDSCVRALLGLGDDQAGEDAAGLILAQFNGLLFQALLDPDLAIEGDRMRHAQGRLRGVLPKAG